MASETIRSGCHAPRSSDNLNLILSYRSTFQVTAPALVSLRQHHHHSQTQLETRTAPSIRQHEADTPPCFSLSYSCPSQTTILTHAKTSTYAPSLSWAAQHPPHNRYPWLACWAPPRILVQLRLGRLYLLSHAHAPSDFRSEHRPPPRRYW